MPITVKTFATLGEAASALQSDHGARFLAGGTLVMRDVNEGRLTEGTLVRVTDPAFRQVSTGGSRIELGAGVTMAQILASRELAFLHPAAKAVGGPAIRNMATVGGNLFAPAPMAISPSRCSRSTPGVLQGTRGPGYAAGGVSCRPRAGTTNGCRRRPFNRAGQSGGHSAFARLPGETQGHLGARHRRRTCRPMAGRIAGDASPMARWHRRRSARRVERALEGARSTRAASRRPSARRGRRHQPATDAIASAWYRARDVAGASRAGCCRRTREAKHGQDPVQFRLNGADNAEFVESGGRRCSTALRDGSATPRPNAAAARAPAVSARCSIDGEP